MTNKKLYDTKEVLQIIPCTLAHLLNSIHRGDIPSIKIGRRYYIPSWWIDKQINEPLGKVGV